LAGGVRLVRLNAVVGFLVWSGVFVLFAFALDVLVCTATPRFARVFSWFAASLFEGFVSGAVM